MQMTSNSLTSRDKRILLSGMALCTAGTQGQVLGSSAFAVRSTASAGNAHTLSVTVVSAPSSHGTQTGTRT